MGFWDKASQALGTGVQLGVRFQEREADREEREKDREERKERFERQDARAQEAHDIHMEEATEKRTHRKVKQGIGQMIGLMNVGEEDAAIKVAQDLYRGLYPNGQDVLVFNREWDPENKIWEKQDKDTKYLVVTGREGEKANPVPFKSAQDIVNMFEPYLDYDKYSAEMKELKKQRNTYNAAQESFVANDGKRYIKQMDDNGEVKTVPHEGVVRESKLQEKFRETEAALGGIRKDDKRKMAGLETSSEIALRNAQAAKARAEGKAAGEKGKGGTLDKKTIEAHKENLKMALSPFVSKGKPVLDPETGDLNEAGDNGLKVAGALIDKAATKPDSLTSEDRRNLPHAKRAWELYGKISGHIAATYGVKDEATPAEIEAEAKRRGFVKDASGKWVKPSGQAGPGKPGDKSRAGLTPGQKPSRQNPPLPGTSPVEGGFDPVTGSETSEPVRLTLGGGPPAEGAIPAEDEDPLYRR